MGKYASKVIEQAQGWIGKKENNGTHREIIDVYNSHKPLARGYAVKYTDAWCSTFVSAVAVKLGYTDIIPTECGCEKHIQLFKNIGAWVENENRVPNVGDIIFYDWQDNGSGDNKGSSDHVGIVEKVSGTTITVIEGNINNSVGRRNLQVSGRYIRGYGVPKYDKEVVSTTTTQKTGEVAKIQSTLNKRYGFNIAVDDIFGNETKKALVKALQTELNKQYNAGLKVDGLFGVMTRNKIVKLKQGNKGNITYILQSILYCLGFDCKGLDGIFGVNTLKSVKNFQKSEKINIDGIVGSTTWGRLFK